MDKIKTRKMINGLFFLFDQSGKLECEKSPRKAWFKYHKRHRDVGPALIEHYNLSMVWQVWARRYEHVRQHLGLQFLTSSKTILHTKTSTGWKDACEVPTNVAPHRNASASILFLAALYQATKTIAFCNARTCGIVSWSWAAWAISKI